MNDFYSANILNYVQVERLPLWVEYVERGCHIERSFHDHDFSEIALVLHGEARHLLGKSSSAIRAGDILVIHPGYFHAYDKTVDMELINIVYDPKKLSLPILDAYSLPMFRIFFPIESISEQIMVKPVMALSNEALQSIFKRIKQLEEELKSVKPGNFFLSLALFMEIIGLLARHDANTITEHQSRFLIGDVISFINKNFQKHISVDAIVKISKMSRRNFFRSFKSTTGYSPVEYMKKIRLQHAAEMLLHSNMTINEIAAKCGFYDSNYLCRIFKKEMRITPRKFRSSDIHNALCPSRQ